jgi:hypothetical protein
VPIPDVARVLRHESSSLAGECGLPPRCRIEVNSSSLDPRGAYFAVAPDLCAGACFLRLAPTGAATSQGDRTSGSDHAIRRPLSDSIRRSLASASRSRSVGGELDIDASPGHGCAATGPECGL